MIRGYAQLLVVGSVCAVLWLLVILLIRAIW